MLKTTIAKKIILLTAAVALIVGFFLIPPHKTWLSTRLLPYYKEFTQQKNNLNIEHRKQVRFGYFYTCCKQMTRPFAAKQDKRNILLLMPPTPYFKERGIDFEACEPGIFYYLTNIRTVPVASANAVKANWYIRVENKKIIVDSVSDINSLRDTIAAMKKIASIL